MNKITNKIVFSVIHLAHLNFFKKAIENFNNKGFNIEIIYLDRGKIEKVLIKEFPQYKLTKIGVYSPSTFGKIFMVLKRIKGILSYLRKSKPIITLGVGDFVLAFCSRLLGIKSVLFYDDYEFKLNFNLSHFFANKLVIPDVIPKRSKKIITYNGFKELAYLHPDFYKPNKKIIEDLGLKQNKYVFVREVAGISMNYTNLKQEGLVSSIKYLSEKGIKVILSLEDKSRREFYAPYCIILEEPLEDVYSIMNYALFCLSSGDSMARESALLGVPCIYTGGREMYANNPFLSWEGIYKIEEETEIFRKIDQLSNENEKKKWQLKIKKIIDTQLINTVNIIVDFVLFEVGVSK